MAVEDVLQVALLMSPSRPGVLLLLVRSVTVLMVEVIPSREVVVRSSLVCVVLLRPVDLAALAMVRRR